MLLGQRLADAVDGERLQALADLVEQHQLRLGQQRAGDLDRGLLAAAQGAGLLAQPLADEGEHRHHAVARRAEAAVGQRQAAEPEVLVDAELGEEGVVLRRIGDAAGDDPMGRPAADVAVEEGDAAAAGGDQSDQRLEEGRFPGAVLADQGIDVARGDLDADVAQHGGVAIAALETLAGDGRAHGAPRVRERPR